MPRLSRKKKRGSKIIKKKIQRKEKNTKKRTKKGGMNGEFVQKKKQPEENRTTDNEKTIKRSLYPNNCTKNETNNSCWGFTDINNKINTNINV